MKDFIEIKIRSRQKIRPEFKRVIKETRDFLLGTQKQIDEAETNGADLSSLVEKFYSRIEETMNHLLRETDRIAENFTDEEHIYHKDFLRDQLAPLLAPSPLNHRAWKKPLGYAGDYLMMEMLYDDNPFQGGSAFFKIINATSCRCVSGKFSAARVPYLLDKFKMLGQETIRLRGVFRVLNLACGPSKEIQEFIRTDPLSHQVEFYLVDQDQDAIAYSRNKIEKMKLESGSQVQIFYYPQPIKELFVSDVIQKWPPFDFIYSGGLFDYFDDTTFEMAVQVLYGFLAPGGVMAIGNISPDDYSKTVKWYLNDWPLIYRNHKELLQFTPKEPPPQDVRIETEETEYNLFLVIKK